MQIDPQVRQSYDLLAEYAAQNYDTVFRPSDAGLAKSDMAALSDAGLAFLEEDGTVTLSEEHFPVNYEARQSSRFADTDRIRVLVEANPKRAGTKTHARFALYFPDPGTGVGPTVLEYIEAAVATGTSRAQARNDVRWDLDHGHIEVHPV